MGSKGSLPTHSPGSLFLEESQVVGDGSVIPGMALPGELNIPREW